MIRPSGERERREAEERRRGAEAYEAKARASAEEAERVRRAFEQDRVAARARAGRQAELDRAAAKVAAEQKQRAENQAQERLVARSELQQKITAAFFDLVIVGGVQGFFALCYLSQVISYGRGEGILLFLASALNVVTLPVGLWSLPARHPNRDSAERTGSRTD
jgi:hypothetical protein